MGEESLVGGTAAPGPGRGGPAGVVVGARGWTHAGWAGRFYPDDLPPAWRLAYYANEQEAVWVPPAAWGRRPAWRAAAWAEDLPEGFDVVAELPQEALAAGAAIRRRAWWSALETLSPWLRAVVVLPPAADRAASAAVAALAERWPVRLRAAAPAGVGLARCWEGGAGGGGAGGPDALGLLHLPPGPGLDLRALRAGVEAFLAQAPAAARAMLFLDARAPGPAPEALEAVETICRLLGVGLVDGPAAGADT